VIVIGPSYVRMHFVPPVFEKELRARGHALRAFGFGMSGLRGGELGYYLDRILDLHLPNLKWVLCDVSLEQLRPLEDGNLYKRRLIQWHAPRQYLLMQRAIMASSGSLRERLVYVWRHAQHALLNIGNVGEGVEALSSGSWLAAPRAKKRSSFHAKPWPARRVAKAIKKYMKHERQHEKALKRLIEKRERGAVRTPQPNAMMIAWRDRIRSHGLHPAFILSPILKDIRIVTDVPGDEPLVMLDFNDPRAHPELYEPELRYNSTHFHYEGARRFSVALADAFAQLLDRTGGGAETGSVVQADTESEPEAEPEPETDTEPETEAETEIEIEVEEPESALDQN
jgi:hypothetical protein